MLGVSLFDRLPRGVQPTWYGEIMIRHARMVLSTLSRAHDEITALKSGLAGQINLGAIMGPSTTLVPRAIIAMKQRFPGVQLNVSIETSDVLQQRLQQGRLDLLVARLFETHDKSRLNYEELSREPVALVTRPGHPLRRCRRAHAARPDVLGLDPAARRQRPAASFRPDVPAGGSGAADRRRRDSRPAGRHQPAPADRPGRPGADRDRAPLRAARHGGRIADRPRLRNGRLRHHHAPGRSPAAGWRASSTCCANWPESSTGRAGWRGWPIAGSAAP